MAYSESRKKGYHDERPLWQWLIIYLVIGGIIYAAIYYFYFTKSGTAPYGATSASPTPIQTINQNTVTATANDFQPTNITIKLGTKVTWTNSSGNDISLDSDPHPTHSSYSPLNIGVIKNGATASLSFPKAGVYHYHNHFQPNQTGTITVQ